MKGRGGVAREVPGARGAQQAAEGPARAWRWDALSGLKGLASNALHASSGPVPTTTTWSICTLAPPSSSSVFFSVDFTTVAPLAAGAMPLKPRAVMGAPLRARPPSAAPAPRRFAAGAAPAPPSAAAAGVNTKPCAGHVSAAPAGVSSLPSAYAASSSREEILEGNKRCTAADGNIEAIGPAGHAGRYEGGVAPPPSPRQTHQLPLALVAQTSPRVASCPCRRSCFTERPARPCGCGLRCARSGSLVLD